MATVTFTYSPSYEQKEPSAKSIQPSLEYRLEIPDDMSLFTDDVYYHVNAWLRGLGYVIPD